MVNHLSDATTLANGVRMPWLGFGVYKVSEGDEVVQAVKTAIDVGYRSIDTASFYENEEGVGRALKESDVAREELFLTSKVWNDEQGYNETLAAFDRSLNRLQTDYLDLYLIHWPMKQTYEDTWHALGKLYDSGRVKAIGVSNFEIHHLKELLKGHTHKPVVNQVELHPRFAQKELRAFCQEHNVQVEAWGPLGQGRLLDHPVLEEVGKKHGKSPAQVMLRWAIQNDVVVIPKSTTPARIQANADIFDFSLDGEDVAKIDTINEEKRYSGNPDEIGGWI
ncbi:aldo/keto reductase [Litoribacterium kuwaitense]|uniref:aldo/keto reductase n=1 Tax=Litoribacterium kuwaitense TaxID=1398745 RepID=UPI0028AE46F0|nr:aldo/keto reductase [Litoribacterium kuwaitense]